MSVSKIEWTDRTWNSVRGCSRISDGCRHCYAETFANRYSGPGKTWDGFVRDGKWTGRVELIESKLDEPLRWRKSQRVFVNSMSDLFHEALPDEAIDRVFAVMALAPQHTFQVLTKRPERMRRYFQAGDELWESRWPRAQQVLVGECEPTPFPLPNVWLGVSVEDQSAADERIPLLLETPAAVRFVSAEPLLESVFLRISPGRRVVRCPGCGGDRWQGIGPCGLCGANPPLGIDWVIVGGESGPGARSCDVHWIRSIVKQCQGPKVPVFVKQLGGTPVDSGCLSASGLDAPWPSATKTGAAYPPSILLRHSKGGDPAEWPDDLRVREFPDQRVNTK